MADTLRYTVTLLKIKRIVPCSNGDIYFLFTLSLVATRVISVYTYFITSISLVGALLVLVSSFSVSLLLVLLPNSDLTEASDAVKAFRLASRASFSLINPLYAATTSERSPKS